MSEIFRQAQIVCFDTTFHVIDAPRVLLEAHHRIVDLVVVDLAARRQPAVRRLVSRKQRFLSGLRILELGLQAGDVLIEFRESLVDGNIIRLYRVNSRLYPRLLYQRRLGQILAPLANRQFGFFVPVANLGVE